MSSPVRKRSIVLDGHKTSISLEEPFWLGLKEIAQSRSDSLSNVVRSIEASREHGNLSSAIRLFVLQIARADAQSAMVGSTHTRHSGL